MSTSHAEQAFHVYDTTLRDGAQQEGLNLSVADKLSIARQLDGLGVGYIEGGWPGSNPKDTEFFRRAREELDLQHATLAAFGATRRAGVRAADDPLVAALRDSGASVVTLVAKSHDRHVELALRTTLEENLAMVRDTVGHLRAEGQRVFLDAEHFFDGYRANRDYALEVLRTAYDAGAEVVALCDTNGGMLPDWVGDVVQDVLSTGVRVGIHCHNDTGCAVANTLSAVAAGATHVQGTLNGYGERTGNADLVSVVANLELKLGRPVLPEGRLRDATRIAHAVAEVTNFPPASRQPYVGTSAFAHKAGLHASAIKVDPNLYQHLDPELVGNDMRLLISDMAGRASIELKGAELGLRPRRTTGSWSPGSPTGSRRWSHRATPSRRPTRPSSCCSSRRSRVPVRRTSRWSRGGSSPTPSPARRPCRRRPSSCSRAARGSSPPARATAPSTRSTSRCARRSARPTRRSRSSSSSTTRCASSTRGTAPTR